MVNQNVRADPLLLESRLRISGQLLIGDVDLKALPPVIMERLVMTEREVKAAVAVLLFL